MKQSKLPRLYVFKFCCVVILIFLAGCIKPLRPEASVENVREGIKVPPIDMPQQGNSSEYDLPITSMPEDSFWVKPTFKQGQLPDQKIANLSLTDRGLFDILQLIFSESRIPLTFEGGPASLSRYGSVSVSNLSGSLTEVMNQLGEMLGFFWTVTDSGILRISPDQQFVIEMPPILSEDNMAGFTNTIQYLGAKDVFLDRINRTLVFRANRRALEGIQGYMNESRRTRSVIVYDMNVLQVALNDSDSMGIRWSALREGAGLTDAGTGPAGLSGFSASNSDSQFDTFIFGRNFQVNMLLDFLRTQGDVKTLSQPKIGLMNGTNGSIRVGQQTTFVSRVGQQIVNGVSQSQAETEDLETGLEISLTGEVHDATVYSRIDISIRELLALNSFSALGVELNLPEVADRVLQTQVRSRPGDTVLLGGITVSRAQDAYVDGITEGSRTDETSLTELVITIRPTILKFVQQDALSTPNQPVIEKPSVSEVVAPTPLSEATPADPVLSSSEAIAVVDATTATVVDSTTPTVVDTTTATVVAPNSVSSSAIPEPMLAQHDHPLNEELNTQINQQAIQEQVASQELVTNETVELNNLEPPVAVAVPVVFRDFVEKKVVLPPSSYALVVPVLLQPTVADNPVAAPLNSMPVVVTPVHVVPNPEPVAALPIDNFVASTNPAPALRQERAHWSSTSKFKSATVGAFAEHVVNLVKDGKQFYGALIPEPDWGAKLKSVVSNQSGIQPLAHTQKPQGRTQVSQTEHTFELKKLKVSQDIRTVPSSSNGSFLSSSSALGFSSR